MSHLQLVADNRNIPQPYRTRRERERRREELGIVGHYGGRCLPVPLEVAQFGMPGQARGAADNLYAPRAYHGGYPGSFPAAGATGSLADVPNVVFPDRDDDDDVQPPCDV